MTTDSVTVKAFPRPQTIFTRDPQLRAIGQQLEQSVLEQAKMGPVVYPPRSIDEAIGYLGDEGGRILVGEGIWTFYEQLVITRPNVHIQAVSPQKTVFVNKIDDAVSANEVMIVVEGDEFIIDGVRFINEENSQHQVKITGDHATIRNCVFEKFYAGSTVLGGDYARIEGNRFLDGTGGYNLALFSSSHNTIANNIFPDTTGTQLYLSDSVYKTVIVGNVFDWSSGTVSIKRTTGVQSAADIATMNVVDASNVTER